MVATVTPATLADRRRRGDKLTLIDVRTPAEYGEVHVDFARNVPLDRLTSQDIAGLGGDGPVYFVCKSGGRSHKACEKMLAAGIDKVVSVEGGTLRAKSTWTSPYSAGVRTSISVRLSPRRRRSASVAGVTVATMGNPPGGRGRRRRPMASATGNIS